MENVEFNEEKAYNELESRYDEAKELLEDEDKLERFLQRLEKKLNEVPVVGNKLADIPIMISLVKSYVRKEYTDLPIGTIIAVISALIYFLSPIDLVPDNIPVIGLIDDAAVVAACWKLTESDIKEYIEWREKMVK